MNIRELITEEFQLSIPDMFGDFLPIAMQVLKIDKLPKIHLKAHIRDQEQPTFGGYVNDEIAIYLAIADRHPNDILRTLAHELVHFKQHSQGQLELHSGDTGSPEENEANQVAGIIMRYFNKKYPNYISTKPLTLDEHKKGVRAKKYNKKPKKYIQPTAPTAPTAPTLNVDEANKRKRKSRRTSAAYGPGPYGGYGYYAGYSGDSGAGGDGGGESINYETSLGNVLQWPEVVNKVNSAMKATGWKGKRMNDDAFMFTTKGAEVEDQWYIAIIDNAGEGFFTYALGTVEEGDPHIDDAFKGRLPNTEASVSELMNEIRDGFGLNENFADGKNPQDKGDSKRHGVPTKASVSTLRKVAKQGGRKGQLAHWMANMKAGKKK